VKICKVILPSITGDENEMAVVTKGYVTKTWIVNRSNASKLLDTRMMKERCTRSHIKVCTSINQPSKHDGELNANLTTSKHDGELNANLRTAKYDGEFNANLTTAKHDGEFIANLTTAKHDGELNAILQMIPSTFYQQRSCQQMSETKSNFASFASDCTSRIGCRISSLCTTSRCCSLSLNSLRISSSLLTAFTLRSFFCSCCC